MLRDFNNRLFAPLLMVLITGVGHAQVVYESTSGLCVECIKPDVYIHTFQHSNGMIYCDRGEAVVVSTPPSDIATQELIRWVEDSLKAKIVAYVIDRWHPDAMEGLDVVHDHGLASYSLEKTAIIAREKGLPVPQNTFKRKKSIVVGKKKVECHFLGEAHTTDGIVVWVPREKVLFGGNEIRNFNGWIGNIGDANVGAWSTTVERVQEYYGEAEYVIPGHGRFGGPELIAYTIELYGFDMQQENLFAPSVERKPMEDSLFGFFISYQDSTHGGDKIGFGQGSISLSGKEKEFTFFFDVAHLTEEEQLVFIPVGCVTIRSNEELLNFCFEELYLQKRDDEVAFTVVVKKIYEPD